MSTLREAAEKALKALDVATTPLAKDRQEVLSAMAALRAELAKPDAPAAAPGGWQGLTEQERTKAVSAIEGYGTDFVAPIYAVIEGIERTLFERNTPRPAPAEPQPIAAWSIVRTAESAVVTAVRAALSAAPAPQPAGGERERYEFVLAQCREAQDIAASRGWALNDIATASTTDPRARKIATEALLSALSQPAAQQEPAVEHCLWSRNGHARCPIPQRKPLADEQIDRHSIAAVDCPPSSTVILVSSLRRLLNTKGDGHD